MKSKMLLSAILFAALLVHSHCFTMNNTGKEDSTVGSCLGTSLVYKHADWPLIMVLFSYENRKYVMEQLEGRSFKLPLSIVIERGTEDSTIREFFLFLDSKCIGFDISRVCFHSTMVKEQTLNYIAQVCPNIEELFLFNCCPLSCSWGDCKGFKNWKNFKNLKKINLCYSSIDLEGLNSIADNCPVEEINLARCKSVVWDNVAWEKFKNLKKINLSYSKVTSQTLDRIVLCCPKIEEISARYCKKINEAFESKIKKEKPVRFNFDFFCYASKYEKENSARYLKKMNEELEPKKHKIASFDFDWDGAQSKSQMNWLRVWKSAIYEYFVSKK